MAAAGCGSTEQNSRAPSVRTPRLPPSRPRPKRPARQPPSRPDRRRVAGSCGVSSETRASRYTPPTRTGRTRNRCCRRAPKEQPHWSPDGSKVAVLATDRAMAVGAVVNADGTGYHAFRTPRRDQSGVRCVVTGQCPAGLRRVRRPRARRCLHGARHGRHGAAAADQDQGRALRLGRRLRRCSSAGSVLKTPTTATH